MSLTEAIANEGSKTTTGAPISSPTLSISDRPANAVPAITPTTPATHVHKSDGHDEELKNLLHSLATKMELRKGDIVMEEGDLYQRIYSIVSGEVTVSHEVYTMGPGQVIGYVSFSITS
jgi:CRP-like cAMP-binding protein